MPYIKQENREKLQKAIDDLAKAIYISTDEQDLKGVLNYTITKILLHPSLLKGEKWRYHTFCDVVGTLECIKLEIYRSLIIPYENKAIKKNGDLPEFEE